MIRPHPGAHASAQNCLDPLDTERHRGSGGSGGCSYRCPFSASLKSSAARAESFPSTALRLSDSSENLRNFGSSNCVGIFTTPDVFAEAEQIESIQPHELGATRRKGRQIGHTRYRRIPARGEGRQVPLNYRRSGGMVDAHALGACGCGRAGSNPASPTRFDQESRTFQIRFTLAM